MNDSACIIPICEITKDLIITLLPYNVKFLIFHKKRES